MFQVAVLLLAAVASAVAAPACNATPFTGGVDLVTSLQVGTTGIPATPGQTISATLVDLRNCQPFQVDGFHPGKLTRFAGAILDADSDLSGEGFSSIKIVVDNSVAIEASVPDGSQHLTYSADVAFTPGGQVQWDFVTKNLGVIITAA